MSGGAFDYNQYRIGYIADDIERVIEKNGRKKTDDELKDESWNHQDYYEKHPDELYHYKYSDEVIEEFKKAVNYLRIAQIYAHRVDWLLSSDDSDESFIKRLKKDIEKLNDTIL